MAPSRIRNTLFAAAGAALLCTKVSAETWTQVADSSIGGLESCVDTDAIQRLPDGRTEFRFAFCGVAKGANPVRVDCRQDFSGKVTLEQRGRDGTFRTSQTEPSAPVTQAAVWVCRHR